jgi:hypothetical protein
MFEFINKLFRRGSEKTEAPSAPYKIETANQKVAPEVNVEKLAKPGADLPKKSRRPRNRNKAKAAVTESKTKSGNGAVKQSASNNAKPTPPSSRIRKEHQAPKK